VFHCVMQGAASIHEDFRQPPFLCPLELVKLRFLLAWTREDIVARYDALLAVLATEEFCGTHVAASFSTWITRRKMEV
jgi:archaemetzincin